MNAAAWPAPDVERATRQGDLADGPLVARFAGGVSVDPRGPLGKRGEDLACEALRRSGYAVVERRFRTRMGEIDIIARDGETIVFVEVKTRSGGNFGTPFDSVTWQKRRRLCTMAAEYVFTRRLAGRPCRFDVVAVTESRGAVPRVEIVQRAFDVNW